ncbi:MAG: transposase [Spirulina sp.]
MTKKDFLAPEQKKYLQQALRTSQYPEVRERILMFLLLNDGKTQAEIAEFLGCSRRTVAYWCRHGDPKDLSSLQDRKHQGNNKKVTDEYCQKLLEIVKQSPAELGLDFEKWTANRLAKYMFDIVGIQLSDSQLRRLLKTNND